MESIDKLKNVGEYRISRITIPSTREIIAWSLAYDSQHGVLQLSMVQLRSPNANAILVRNNAGLAGLTLLCRHADLQGLALLKKHAGLWRPALLRWHANY